MNISDSKRIVTLNKRREKLIELNRINGYTVEGHSKADKYIGLLLEIRRQKYAIWKANRDNDIEYQKQLDNAKKAVGTMLKESVTKRANQFKI